MYFVVAPLGIVRSLDTGVTISPSVTNDAEFFIVEGGTRERSSGTAMMQFAWRTWVRQALLTASGWIFGQLSFLILDYWRTS